jgi:hypothetical protein
MEQLTKRSFGRSLRCASFTPHKKEEAIKLLWDEYKLRYRNYWSIFNRFSLAILTITVIPYVKPDIVKPLGKLIIAFPFVSFFLALACSWLLGAEYQRLDMVRIKYDELITEKYQPVKLPTETFIQRLLAKRIGTRIALMFLIGFTLISIVNFILLFYIKINP